MIHYFLKCANLLFFLNESEMNDISACLCVKYRARYQHIFNAHISPFALNSWKNLCRQALVVQIHRDSCCYARLLALSL